MDSHAAKNYEKKYKFLKDDRELFEKIKEFTKKFISDNDSMESWYQKDEYFKKKNESKDHEFSKYERIKVRTMTSRLTRKTYRQLIAYNRPNGGGEPQESNYVKINYRNHGDVSEKINGILKSFYEPDVVVKKERTVYFYKNTRIHLDDVKSLGFFLEFEYVVPNDNTFKDDHEEVYSFLTKKYRLEETSMFQRIHVSYSDLIDPNIF
jgi:predicted adenylyl cyclase CyaB